MKTVFEVEICLPFRDDVEFWHSDNEVVPNLLDYSMEFQQAYANAAAIAYRLQQAGWSLDGVQCSIRCDPPGGDFSSVEEAENALRATGVDPDKVYIFESERDGDWDDEDAEE